MNRREFLIHLGWIAFLCLLCSAGGKLQAQASSMLLESGEFRLHKFAQGIGEEKYTLQRDGATLTLDSNFHFTDRGSAVPLSTTLRMRPDLTPERFTIKGQVARPVGIDTEVAIEGAKATVKQGKRTRTVDVPTRSFTISGYAPVAMQMLLMRYWLHHGRPAMLSTLPGGQIRIERRGSDTIQVDGKPVELDRYGVSGLVWGRETLWMNRHEELIALVTCDAEFDHFEALRKGYESCLPQFITLAGTG